MECGIPSPLAGSTVPPPAGNLSPMRIVSSVGAMQRLALGWRRRGTTVALVPTMGSLHDGHLSLVHLARQRVGNQGVVVVSIYVNPTQFGPREDFSSYPRNPVRDRRLCRNAGVDVLFIPHSRQMYPATKGATFSTFVVEEQVSRGMEGKARPGHFRGVTTIVAKLFNIVLPDLAVFGAKDYQQAAVIRRMARDLNFPISILVAPTVRGTGGLALSSRNQYLTVDQRGQAAVIRGAIRQARQYVLRSGRAVSAGRLKALTKRLIEARPAARVDYVEFFDPRTFEPRSNVRPGDHMALAVFLGRTRLIDNGRL